MTENEKWNAVLSNDVKAAGLFYYAVRSTGIFCRPSCSSREPVRENVEFFDSPPEAQAAGFRPCKRCRPDLWSYNPSADLAQRAKEGIDRSYKEKLELDGALKELGISKSRLRQIFIQEYGLTPNKYRNQLKIRRAIELLAYSEEPIINIAASLEYDSLPAFFAFFRKYTGQTPGEFRRQTKGYAGEVFDSEPISYGVYDTSFGSITIASDGSSIQSVRFGHQIPEEGGDHKTELLDQTARQLEDYFTGKRQSFSLPLSLKGTPFQRRVWEEISLIPYGETRSYKEIAEPIGKPNASRAVGMANNKNPLLLLIPCHRVIGANGALVGYAGGIEVKEKFLQLEKKFKQSILRKTSRIEQ